MHNHSSIKQKRNTWFLIYNHGSQTFWKSHMITPKPLIVCHFLHDTRWVFEGFESTITSAYLILILLLSKTKNRRFFDSKIFEKLELTITLRKKKTKYPLHQCWLVPDLCWMVISFFLITVWVGYSNFFWGITHGININMCFENLNLLIIQFSLSE